MRLAHNITITEFAKNDEDLQSMKESLKLLLPFSLEQEKIALQEQTAQGFEEQQIKILTIFLQKETHTNNFFDFLNSKLSNEQKKLLLLQKESRIDNHFCFFMRFDKEKWNKSKEIFITDSGNCIHIKLALAVFPAKRESALKLIEKIFC